MATVPLLVIFICGVDYDYIVRGLKPGRPVDWTQTSKSRERQLLREIGSRPLIFVTFDIPRGIIVERNYEARSGEPKTTKRDEWKPISEKQYTVAKSGGLQHVVFTGKASDHLCAHVIYKQILSLVEARSAKILELSIFSHAYADGPILANTNPFERVRRVGGENVLVNISGTIPGVRDPDDFDFRPADFSVDGGQSESNLQRWRTAFASEGYSWVWGCNEDHRMKILMRAMKAGRPVVTRSTKSTAKIIVPLKSYQLEALTEISKDLVSLTEKKGTYEITFGRFLAEVGRRLKGTYAQKLANGTGRTVYSAAPGTAATYARNQVDMILDTHSSEIVQIYKSIFGRRVDPRNLGYIEYLAETSP